MDPDRHCHHLPASSAATGIPCFPSSRVGYGTSRGAGRGCAAYRKRLCKKCVLCTACLWERKLSAGVLHGEVSCCCVIRRMAAVLSRAGWLAVAAAAGSPSDWLIRWSCKSGLECPPWPLCLSKSMLGKSIAVQWERWAPRCCEAALTSVVCSLFESRWGCVRLRDPMRQLLVSERAPCLPELPRDDKYLWSDIQDDTAGWVKLEASPGWKSARTSQPQPCPATPGKGPCNLFALTLDRSREVKILCWGTGGSRWLLVAGLWRSHCLGFCSGYLEPWY